MGDKGLVRPLFERVDCVYIQVANIDDGLAFYQNALGLKLLWRTKNACGLGLKTGDTELVLSTEDYITVDLKVDNVENSCVAEE